MRAVSRPAPRGEVVLVELLLKRKNGALGIAIRDDTRVSEVDAGSGGDEAGLRVGDFVMELNGVAVDNYMEMLPMLKSVPANGMRAVVRREVGDGSVVPPLAVAAPTTGAPSASDNKPAPLPLRGVRGSDGVVQPAVKPTPPSLPDQLSDAGAPLTAADTAAGELANVPAEPPSPTTTEELEAEAHEKELDVLAMETGRSFALGVMQAGVERALREEGAKAVAQKAAAEEEARLLSYEGVRKAAAAAQQAVMTSGLPEVLGSPATGRSAEEATTTDEPAVAGPRPSAHKSAPPATVPKKGSGLQDALKATFNIDLACCAPRAAKRLTHVPPGPTDISGASSTLRENTKK